MYTYIIHIYGNIHLQTHRYNSCILYAYYNHLLQYIVHEHSVGNISIANQIKSLLLSHHHSTSALVSEILTSVLQTVQKNNRQFTYGQTVQKNNKQFTYGQTVQKNCTGAFTVLQTVQKKKNNNSNLHMDRQCKKKQQQFTYGQYIFTDCTEDNVQNTHTYTQYT